MAEPIDEDDDDLCDYQPPKGPSPREVRAGWARGGDVDSLWRLLVDSPPDRIDQEDVFKLLIQALEVRSRDPERFAADVFALMTAFTSSILLRCHLYPAKHIEGSGRAARMRGQPPGDLPNLAVEKLIPRVVQLQEHLAALLLSQSSVARQWALVRRNRSKGDEATAVRPDAAEDKKRSARGPDPGPEGRANGKAGHRLAAPRNGRGAGANGARHDD